MSLFVFFFLCLYFLPFLELMPKGLGSLGGVSRSVLVFHRVGPFHPVQDFMRSVLGFVH